MAHWSSSPTSPSPASRSRSRTPSESFTGSLRGGMATLGWTPTPDLPPLGNWSGLPLIPCPECGGRLVEEYIPRLGGTCERCREEAGVHGGGCSFFKTQEEYEAILRDRGMLGPAATPEQQRGYLVQAPSGFLVPKPVGNPQVFAALEDLKHEVVAQRLAIAQLTTNIEDFMDKVEKATKNKLAIAQLKTDIQDFKGKPGAEDKVQKATITDLLARWAKAIIKWFSVANVVITLFCIVVAMFV